MVEVIGRLTLMRAVPQQDEGVTYAAKIEKAEAHLDLSLAAEQVERAIRAFNPVPGAWVEIAGERLKILAADVTAESGSPGVVLGDRLTIACGSGAIRPTLAQRQGKGAMEPGALLRGWPLPDRKSTRLNSSH